MALIDNILNGVRRNTTEVPLSDFYEWCLRRTLLLGDTYIANNGMIYRKGKNGFWPPKEREKRYYYDILRRNGYKFKMQNSSNEMDDYVIEGH